MKWRYFKLVGGLWLRNISGPLLALITIALTFASAYFANNVVAAAATLRYSAWVTGAACIVLVFIAQYDAWNDARKQYEDELAKNQRPEIHGEAFRFETAGFTGEGPNSCHVGLRFQLVLSNHRPVGTNVVDVEIDGTGLTFPGRFSEDAQLIEAEVLTPNQRPELRPGIRVQFPWQVTLEVPGHRVGELDGMDLTKLKIDVIDGFGGRHRISVRHGETL